MHWQDLPTKSDSASNSIKLQSSTPIRFNKFFSQKSYSFNISTPLKNKSLTSEIVIQTAVSRVKDNKTQSNKKHKQYLKNRVREISLGQKTPLQKDKNDQFAKQNNKRINTPASVYKIVRDMKNLLVNLKGTLQLITRMFQISLVAWRKGMDQFSKKNASLLQTHLEKATSAISRYTYSADSLLAQSAPQKQFSNNISRNKKLNKKYTLTSIPDAHDDDLQQDFNFELKQKSVHCLRFPDLSSRDVKTEKMNTEQQVQDSGQNSKSNTIQMSSNLETANHGKSLISKNAFNYPNVRNFDGASLQFSPKLKKRQNTDDNQDNSQILIEKDNFSNIQNRYSRQNIQNRQNSEKRQNKLTVTFSESPEKSKISKKERQENILRRQNSRKKEIQGDFDEINNYLLKLKLMVQ